MENKLRECPFCGGKAEIVFSGKQWSDEWKEYIIAKCSRCGGAAKGFYYRGEPIEYPLEETVGGEYAADAWNTRDNICMRCPNKCLAAGVCKERVQFGRDE